MLLKSVHTLINTYNVFQKNKYVYEKKLAGLNSICHQILPHSNTLAYLYEPN